MSIAAKVSAAELNAQVTNRFVDQYYEARLIYAPGTSYLPGITTDATFLADEVAAGTGGYVRQVIKYVNADVGLYADDGVGLATKATVFAHDGGATVLSFSHIALVKSTGNVLTFGAVTTKPSNAINGTYTDIPVTTAGAGKGLTANLVVTNNGASLSDYALTVMDSGYGFAASDALQIQDSALAAVGAINPGAGTIGFTAATVSSPSDAGNILAVAETSGTVSLTAGNEAAFYWNLKQYGI
jgi:hypothetical protein